jgi:glutathione S-transferase
MVLGKPQDRAKIDASIPDMRYAIEQLDRAYEGKEWIAGTFSLADLFIGPIVVTAALFPEGQKALEESGKNLTRLVAQLRTRKSAEFLDPPLRR